MSSQLRQTGSGQDTDAVLHIAAEIIPFNLYHSSFSIHRPQFTGLKWCGLVLI